MTFTATETVAILGTSRSEGNTCSTLRAVLDGKEVELIDITQLNIGHYDYLHRNEADAFLPLIEKLVKKRLWILATPVYWYTMSAQMKIFYDRLSDLVTIRKDLGRSLKGISVAVVATGTNEHLPEGFEAPFRLTCEYLDMRYIGALYQQYDGDDQPVAGGTQAVAEIARTWMP
jgi:multimeric flavodoxin WrbA